MAGFNDIIGQEQITAQLKSSIENNTVTHAYLLAGEKGLGKKKIAKTFAMALECTGTGDRPCMECEHCRQALSGSEPDIITVTHEKESVIAVGEIRDQIVDDVYIKPYSSDRKIYIIPEAEKMNVQAQNALLKTLEEPPAYTVIILLTDNPQALLPTIISRCTVLTLKPVRDGVIRKYLTEELHISDHQADICISFARGNAGRARDLAENEEFDSLKNEVLRILKKIKDSQNSYLYDCVKLLSEYKTGVDTVLELITMWYRDILLYKATADEDRLIFSEEKKNIKQAAKETSYESVERVIESLNKTKEMLKANVNYELVMQFLLFAIKEN
ncbi:MAG: DNA polymerase III subunit delta' [Lachnospiraceae bacterium]|nr:DNA polymerase III subunit delta' [Lachnospiraceae bacterium]